MLPIVALAIENDVAYNLKCDLICYIIVQT